VSNQQQVIKGDIEGVRDRFTALAGGAVSFEKEAGFAMQILSASDYAMGIAMSNRNSVIAAVTNVAAIGISLNPAKKQAYLVPRDGRICLDISYMGLLDLAIQSGSILWGQAELVFEQDGFSLNGFDKPPTHNRNPFSKERGEPVGAYVVVKTRDGDFLTACMSMDEINDIRDRSSAWKAWINKKKSCPWVTDPGEMAKKTVIKRAYKLWPKTERFERVETAIQHLNTENGEGLEPEQPKGPGVISATTGAMASLKPEEQDVLREWAMEVIAAFKDEGGGADLAYSVVESYGLEDVQKVALWSLLPSDVRSGLKAAVDAKRKQPKTETPQKAEA
jgi:recombination protein RecT